MIFYESSIKKSIDKRTLPKQILKRFHNVFTMLDETGDLNLFDVKKLKGEFSRNYYRLRKGQYRAIFYIENNSIYVVHIAKRGEVYEAWE